MPAPEESSSSVALASQTRALQEEAARREEEADEQGYEAGRKLAAVPPALLSVLMGAGLALGVGMILTGRPAGIALVVVGSLLGLPSAYVATRWWRGKNPFPSTEAAPQLNEPDSPDRPWRRLQRREP